MNKIIPLAGVKPIVVPMYYLNPDDMYPLYCFMGTPEADNLINLYQVNELEDIVDIINSLPVQIKFPEDVYESRGGDVMYELNKFVLVVNEGDRFIAMYRLKG